MNAITAPQYARYAPKVCSMFLLVSCTTSQNSLSVLNKHRSISMKIKFGDCLFNPLNSVQSGYAFILQSRKLDCLNLAIASSLLQIVICFPSVLVNIVRGQMGSSKWRSIKSSPCSIVVGYDFCTELMTMRIQDYKHIKTAKQVKNSTDFTIFASIVYLILHTTARQVRSNRAKRNFEN